MALRPADDIVRPVDSCNKRGRIQQGGQRNTTAEADFENTIRRRKLELSDRKRIHSPVVPVHQMPDDNANDTVWMRKLLRNKPGRHWLNSEAISSDVRSVHPISVAEFSFEIFFFALYDAEVQNQQARNDE